MWETIKAVLVSDNALSVLSTIIILIILLSVLAKLGIFKLNIKGLTIGEGENERTIIRQQIEWSEVFIQGLQKHPIFNGYDEYHTLWVLEKMFDEVLNWIVFNHISDSENYISIKQEKIWNLVLTLVTEEKFTGKEFQDIVYESTEKLIKRLVYIRHNYRK